MKDLAGLMFTHVYLFSGLHLIHLSSNILFFSASDDDRLPLPSQVHALEHSGGAEAAATIAGDDMLPIFTFVLCRARLAVPVATCALLWGLGDPASLAGESGYYLTVFSAALQFVKGMRPASPRKRRGVGGGSGGNEEEDDDGSSDSESDAI
jgi:hypothetical protein